MLFESLVTLALAQAAAAPRAPDPAGLGPAVGQRVPPFEAPDQSGRLRDLASLAGDNGLVLVFYRSADW